jgi:hypothetical protein
MEIDWSFARKHIEHRSARKGDTDILVEWANEAYFDERRVQFNPDFASKTNKGVRTIGYSKTAGFHITVITVEDEEAGKEGASAWKSNSSDIKRYDRRELL